MLIRDYDTNEVSLDKHNAINYENFAVAIASPTEWNCGSSTTGQGFEIGPDEVSRNGGTVIDATGNVEYRNQTQTIN